MKRTIAIVAGGDTSEFHVSLRSAQGIYSFIDKEKYTLYIVEMHGLDWHVQLPDGAKAPVDRNDFSFVLDGEKVTFDFAYITIHGTPGEDGRLQGYFDMLHIPYSCCGVLAASLTYDKFACNQYLKGFGVRIAESLLLRGGQSVTDEDVMEKIGLPCFIKPSLGGSSFGVTKVTAKEQIQPAIAKAFAEAQEVLVEAFMDGTEITCGCYKTKDKSVVFPITEVVSYNEYFDYEAKYNGASDEITPARISDDLTRRVQTLTSAIYDILGAYGIIRVDYIITEGEKINLLEVNTTPGMTATSFIPQQVRAAGLDIKDVDFKNNGIMVTRKGGNQMVVYFGDEVAEALKNYMAGDRAAATPLPGHEQALFLSTQRKRMGVQAVENMVKKYARQVTPNKKITPHKLRSTYGTSLYKETGDIYLVADVLGHKDVNTTKKHYAAIDDNRRRKAASAVKLREI